MKKLISLLFLLIASTSIKAQEEIDYEPFNAYIGGYASVLHSFSDNTTGLQTGVALSFYDCIYPNLAIRLKTAMKETYGNEFNVGLLFSIGLKWTFFRNFYLHTDMYPKISVHGNGHQVNGDTFAFYTDFSIGIGYLFQVTENSNIMLECGPYKEFTVVNTEQEDLHHAFGVSVWIGYHYKIN